MKNPFLFAAGVDDASMSRCSSSESNKYKTLGGLVYVPLATGIIAVIFASRYFTQNPLTVLFACLLWGGVVFTIERALISSLRPGMFNFAVVFRVLAAFAMSLIISELLIMFLFQDHISEHVAINVDNEIKEIHQDYDNKVAAKQDELKTYSDDLALQEQSLIEEIEGVSGSMRKGDGKVAAEKRNALERKKALYEEEKQRVSDEVAMLKQQEEQAVKACEERRVAGLLGSLVGLHELARTSKTVWWVLIIAHVFFLTIELMPLVIKLSYKGKQYYDIIDLEEGRHLDVARQLSEEETRVLCLKGQQRLKQSEAELNTLSVCADMKANCDQFESIAESLLKSAQKVTELQNRAESTVAAEKLEELKKQLDNLYNTLLQTAAAV